MVCYCMLPHENRQTKLTLRSVQLSIRHYNRTTEASSLLVASPVSFYRLLCFSHLRRHLQLVESGQDLPPGQRLQGFLQYECLFSASRRMGFLFSLVSITNTSS